MSGLVVVSREEFFAYVGPRNIHPRSEWTFTVWETANHRVVGRSTPGCANSGETPRTYMLTVEVPGLRSDDA